MHVAERPKTGAIATISTFLMGMLPQVEPSVQTLIIFYFQVIAFSISIVVGILTAVSYIRKFRRENRNRKKMQEAQAD